MQFIYILMPAKFYKEFERKSPNGIAKKYNNMCSTIKEYTRQMETETIPYK